MATFLITGANRGIGLELCRQLLARGDDVIAASRRPNAQALEALRTADPDAIMCTALDVADAASIGAAKKAVGERRIDVLINNAGIMGPQRQSALDTDFDGFAYTLAVNAMAPLRVAQTFLPNLRESDAAKIVTISSVMGSLNEGGSGHLVYRTSKAAVNKVMQGLADELRPEGIVVGIVHPGWVKTDMGGSNAAVDIPVSAAGILDVVDRWQLTDTGHFRDYTGNQIAW